MKIPYVNIKQQYKSERKELLNIIDKTLASGNWVGGKEVEQFEKTIAKICKTSKMVQLHGC